MPLNIQTRENSIPHTRGKKKFIPDVSPVNTSGLSLQDIRDYAKNNPKDFAKKIHTLVDRGMRWSDVSDLKSLFHALCDVAVPAQASLFGVKRAITTSAFPLLSGALTVAGVNDAYLGVPTIGQELVREMDDSKKETHIVGILTEASESGRRAEGEPFPEIGAGEERFTLKSNQNGFRISVTQEMIDENDIANIVSRVDALGEHAAEHIEEKTLDRVTDRFGSAATPAEPYALYLNGSGTQLYNSTADNPGTRAPNGTRYDSNALVDETDLENVRQRLASMENSRGRRINIPMSESMLLVPDALLDRALKIRGSTLVPGIENEQSQWGPSGPFQPSVLSSPKLDDISTSDWYLGAFKRQFRRKWKLRVEYVTYAGMDTEAYLRMRIPFQARIAWDCEVNAVDYVYVIQSQA